MANTLIRDAILISGIFASGFLAFYHRDTIYEYAGIDPQTIAMARENAKANRQELSQETPQQQTAAAAHERTTTISKSPDGQYWANAMVNNEQVKFLIDTGASVVVLTPKDAEKAGLRPKDLTYNAPMNTASGQVMAAHADIASISIGNVIVHNVRAVVIPKGLTHSLLGMSFLGELRKLEVTPEELILRQ